MSRKISSAQQREKEAKERMIRELLENHEKEKERRLKRWRRSYQKDTGAKRTLSKQQKNKSESSRLNKNGKRRVGAKLDRFSASVLELGGHVDEDGAHAPAASSSLPRNNRTAVRQQRQEGASRRQRKQNGEKTVLAHRFAVEARLRNSLDAQEAEVDNLHSTLLIATTQRVARGFLARKRVKALRTKEEEYILALLQEGSRMERAKAAADLTAATAEAVAATQFEAVGVENEAAAEETSTTAISTATAAATESATAALATPATATSSTTTASTTAEVVESTQFAAVGVDKEAAAEETSATAIATATAAALATPAAASSSTTTAAAAAAAPVAVSELDFNSNHQENVNGLGVVDDSVSDESSDSCTDLSDDDTDALSGEEDEDAVNDEATDRRDQPHRQLPGGFSMLGAVNADHKRDLNVRTGIVRAILAQRIARGFLARRRLQHARNESVAAPSTALALRMNQSVAVADQANMEINEKASANVVGLVEVSPNSATGADNATQIEGSAWVEDEVEHCEVGRFEQKPVNEHSMEEEQEPGLEGEEEAEAEREHEQDEHGRGRAQGQRRSQGQKNRQKQPDRIHDREEDRNEAAILAQRLARGFLGRQLVQQLTADEEASNLQALQSGSVAEARLAAHAFRHAQVVTAQRIVRGQIARTQLARAEAQKALDNLQLLQKGSQIERRATKLQWSQLEEHSRKVQAVRFMQALVRGHLARQQVAQRRQLAGDDGDFSEAEPDESDAEDFF
eukprot:INCI19591.1.p1 GENE.INCI19591.1~~INCI19591.1.p1  ORF type:complete len:848 (+),score=233.09 INCI19591.1:312-2546(+)